MPDDIAQYAKPIEDISEFAEPVNAPVSTVDKNMLPDELKPDFEKIRNSLYYNQTFGIPADKAYDLEPELNVEVFGKEVVNENPAKLAFQAFVQSLADKPAMMIRGIEVYTPGKALGLDKLLDTASTYLNSLKDKKTEKKLQQVASGKLWPVGEDKRWWQLERKYLPEVINSWSVNVADQIPIMLTTMAGRIAGKYIGKPVGAAAGTAVAMVTGGPDPSDTVTASSTVAVTQEVVKHLGGAAPLVGMEAGGFMDSANELEIDEDISEKYARMYGLGSGAIEYAQWLWVLGRYSKITKEAQETILRQVLTHIGGSLFEGVEELSQEGLQNWLMQKAVAEMKERHPDYKGEAPKITANMKRSGIIGAGVAGITGLPGTGMTIAKGQVARMAQVKPETKKFLGEPSVREVRQAQEAVQQPVEPTKPEMRPTTPVEPTLPTTEPAKLQVTPEVEKVKPLTEEEITPEEQKVLEAEEAELVRPRLYIGNVTEGMKRRIADVMNWTKEQIKGFTEKGWPTKRTEVPLTRGEAEVALEDLTKDLKNRLDNNQINTENDLAFANAMWGNIAEIRKSLGMEKGQAPFRVIRAKGQPMKIIKNAKSRIWAAIQPGTLQESKMTVGEVLKAVVKGKAREAKMAWAAGRRELRSAIRMKKRAKARMEEALKSIKKKIPDSVDFYYREAIETLREGIDLKVKTEKAKESIQRTREFLERVPEHEEKMPTKLMERLYKKPLVDYTIEELEQIASEIDTLIEQGKLKRELTEKPKKKFREKVVRKMVDTIEKGKAIKSKTSEIASKGFLWSWRPQRIFDWLDNRANFDGLVHRTFYDSVKDAKAKAWNWVDKRVNPGTAKLKEFGLTQYDLARHRMTVEKSKIGKTERMTLDKMIGVYLFNKNLMSRLALLHGNEFTQEEIDDIISNLSENEKAWGDYMMDDFKKHWERYRSSVIEQENRDPGSAEFYFSMRRQERDYKTLDQEIIDELLHRAGLRKAYAEHGASLKRKHIPPEFQKPIKLDATGVWLEQVTAQEHYMNIGPIVRDLNSILNNNKFRKAVENRGGRALTKWLQNYVNAVANPNFYRSFNDIEKISRMIRQNAAIAYLGFNVVTMGKQLPSVFLYLPDAGISHLLQSAVEFAIDPMKTIREVRELDPFVKHKLMEREFAELEKTRTGTAGLIHQEVGMRSLEGIFFFDMIARTIGWKAVYNRGIADGLSQEEAVRKARNATLRTQPAAAAEDLPQLYRTSEFLNVFTQFTNQLNQLFNIATYDMPSMLLNKKYGDAALGGLGMSIVAATIWMIAHRKLPEEPEEVVEMFSEQAINMLPLFGKSIQAKRNGWESDVPVMQAISTLLGTPIKTLEDWDISEYEFKKILESIAVLTGTPYTQPERVYRAIKEEEPSLLIGGRKKKKKTSRRKIGRRG